MTHADLTLLLLVAWAVLALWAFSAVCAEAYRARMAAFDLEAAAERDADADRVVLDTVERWRRDQDANRIARDVRAAFLDQMTPLPGATPIHDEVAAERLRADLADDARLAEWLEADR